MTLKNFSSACVTSMVAVALLSACGAGDNESAGSVTPFSTVPTKITLTGPDTLTCGSGFAGEVFIFGGAAPYVIRNTTPDAIIVAPTTVASPGGGFTVDVVPGFCLSDAELVVSDQTGKIVTVKVSAVKGS